VKKGIAVEDLRLGMYVSELDRPWTDTPFMFQGFVLRQQDQIDALKKYCKIVYVDPEKSETDGRTSRRPRSSTSSRRRAPSTRTTKR